MAQRVPEKVIQAIEQVKLPKDQVLYHDVKRGWVSEKQNDALNNLTTTKTADNTSSDSSNYAYPLESLGPFGTKRTKISPTITDDVDVWHTELDKNLNRFNISEVFGQRGPIAPVTLTGSALDAANIPRNATHFCWIYPPAGFSELSREEKMEIEQEMMNGNLEYTFFALGGFAYFRAERKSYKLLQTNCLVRADNGLVFQGPFQWNPAYTADLQKQGRFQSVTISTLLDLGIKYYCFINPSERLTSSRSGDEDWIPAPNGGFVYLYDVDLKPHQYDRYFSVSDRPLSEQIKTNVMPFSLVQKRHQPPIIFVNGGASNELASSTADKNDKFLCSICRERTIQCILIPCKHMCVCNECANELRQRGLFTCPMCRQSYREIWNVFM